MDTGRFAGGSSIPQEKYIGRDSVSPVSERTSGPASPTTAQRVFPNYSSPRVPEVDGAGRTATHHTTEHRNCGYTLVSWLPEILCCILGFAAMTGNLFVSPHDCEL